MPIGIYFACSENIIHYFYKNVEALSVFIYAEGFRSFMENEKFKESLGEDVKGILSLYEASYFSIEEESLMQEANSFTSKILKECVKSIDDSDLGLLVSQALELPQQWRIPRFEARWYMDVYERSSDMIPEVLNFAKFDFNIVQGLNQDELKDVSRYCWILQYLFIFLISLPFLYLIFLFFFFI